MVMLMSRKGMAMPYAALTFWGKHGGIAILLMVFMAVTSAMSSETMATSALITHDVYRAYIKPGATGSELVRCSRITVLAFGILVASVAVGLNHAGFSVCSLPPFHPSLGRKVANTYVHQVNYIVTAIGVVVDSAIVPMACTVMWKKQSKLAVIGSPLISSAAAIIAWLTTAYTHYGVVTLDSTSESLPLVAGNMMSVCGPLFVTPLLTYIKPDNYDWDHFKEIKQADDADRGAANALEHDELLAGHELSSVVKTENERLLRARKYAVWASIFLTLAYLILWPIPMYATDYVFSKGFFKGWIVVVFLWSFYAASTIILLPLWEGKRSIFEFTTFMYGWATGKKAPLQGQEPAVAEVATSQEESISKGEKK